MVTISITKIYLIITHLKWQHSVSNAEVEAFHARLNPGLINDIRFMYKYHLSWLACSSMGTSLHIHGRGFRPY